LRRDARLKDERIDQLTDIGTKLIKKCSSQKQSLTSANGTKTELARQLRSASDNTNIVLLAAQLVANDYRQLSLRDLNPCSSIAQGVRDGSIRLASPAYSNQVLEKLAPFAHLFSLN
jgi:hypothetical protein